jgi:hypothetical protein
VNIVPIHEPCGVEPVGVWALECPHGYQAKDATPGGRLVRLAAVVRWIQGVQSLPRMEAVEVLCASLDGRVVGSLYGIKSGAFAVPVPVDSRFGFPKPRGRVQTSAKRQGAASWANSWRVEDCASSPVVMRPFAQVKEGAAGLAINGIAPGLPALLARLRHDWRLCDPFEDTKSLSAYLAVPFGVAHDVWGWGEVGGATRVGKPQEEASQMPERVGCFSDLLTVRKASPGAKWTPDMLRVLLAEEVARSSKPGATGVRAALAGEVGLKSVQRVGQLLAAAKKLPVEAVPLKAGASVFGAR